MKLPRLVLATVLLMMYGITESVSSAPSTKFILQSPTSLLSSPPTTLVQVLFTLTAILSTYATPTLAANPGAYTSPSTTRATLDEAMEQLATTGNATLACFRDEATSGGICEPRARLTPSEPNLAGAVWSTRKYHIADGFAMRFKAHFSDISPTCVSGQGSDCLTRGGHGFALVLQGHAGEERLIQLGRKGNGIGYAGLNNSVALEFDTWYDVGLSDLYNNHIALQTAVPGKELSSHHSSSVAISADINELLDGNVHTVKIQYEPFIDSEILHPSLCINRQACFKLQALPHLSELLSTPVFSEHMGMMQVWVDTFTNPVFIAPVTVETLMALQEGNATVGFTAATGASEWQTTSVYDAEICTNEPAAAMGHYDASDAWRPEDPAATDVDTSVWKCYDMFSGAVSNNTVATLTGNLT